jgi:endoglycosylceramidase
VRRRLSKLHVEGARIVDSLGTEIKLSGFNVHAKGSSDPAAWQPHEDDIKWIKERGFNCIRIVVDWSDFELVQGVYDEAFFANYLDPLVSWCEKYGVYVMIDMHQWNWSPYWGGGDGFPTWACNMYRQDDSGMEECAVDFWKGVGQGAVTKEKLVDAWRYIAARYSGRSVIAFYDLFNEPEGFANGDAHVDEIGPYVMDLYNNKLVPAIRSVDSDTICLYFPISNPDTMSRQTQPNVAWCKNWYHYSYEDTGVEYTTDRYRAKLITDFKPYYDRVCGEFGVPLLQTEIGCDFTLPGNLLWVDDSLKCMSDLASPYGDKGHFFWWRYGKGREWAPRNEDGSDRPVVQILQNHVSPI